MMRVGLVALALALIAVVVFLSRADLRERADRPPDAEPAQGDGDGARRAESERAASRTLKALVAALHEQRRAEQHERAGALLAAIREKLATTMRDEDGLAERREVLLQGLVHAFVGDVCDCVGEALFYSDRCRLAAAEIAVARSQATAALEGVRTLFARGLPEEHDTERQPDARLRHVECDSIRPLLKALVESGQLTESDVRSLLDSQWTRQCDAMRRHIFDLLYPAWSSLVAEVGLEWLGDGTDANVALAIWSALLREGRVSDVMKAAEALDEKALWPVLHALATVPPLDEAFELVAVARRRLQGTSHPSVSYQRAMENAYSWLCRRAVRDEGAESLLKRMLDDLQQGPDDWSGWGYDALMSGIGGACSEVRRREKRELFRPSSDEYDHLQRRFAETAARIYRESGTDMSIDALSALARISSDGGVVLDAVQVLWDEGLRRGAALDAVNALLIARGRGLLDGDDVRARAGRLASRMADRMRDWFGRRLFLRFAREFAAAEILPGLRRLRKQIESELATAADARDLKELLRLAQAAEAAILAK